MTRLELIHEQSPAWPGNTTGDFTAGRPDGSDSPLMLWLVGEWKYRICDVGSMRASRTGIPCLACQHVTIHVIGRQIDCRTLRQC